jgi:TPR repeat protein
MQFLINSQQYMLGYAQQGTNNASPHPFDVSLMPWVLPYVVGCGFKGKLVQLLLQQMGHNLDVLMYRGDSNKMIQNIVYRVAAGLATAVRNKTAKKAEELCTLGQCAAALSPLKLAVDLGHLPSRALMAYMLLEGREGIARVRKGAFELVEEGARLGCHHCQGVLAEYYSRNGYGCVRDAARSLELARESSGKGSRYGQDVLGWLYQFGVGPVARDYAQAFALYRLAAAQNFDEAQYSLGFMYYHGQGVAQDFAEALRLYRLAAAQGHPLALYHVAFCHEFGLGVLQNEAEAIRWYRRAQAAGSPQAAAKLQRFRA